MSLENDEVYGPLDTLRTALANESAVRTFLGVSTVDEAQELIYVDTEDVPSPEPDQWIGVVWVQNDSEARDVAGNTADTYEFDRRVEFYCMKLYDEFSTANRQAFGEAVTSMKRQLKASIKSYDMRLDDDRMLILASGRIPKKYDLVGYQHTTHWRLVS